MTDNLPIAEQATQAHDAVEDKVCNRGLLQYCSVVAHKFDTTQRRHCFEITSHLTLRSPSSLMPSTYGVGNRHWHRQQQQQRNDRPQIFLSLS